MTTTQSVEQQPQQSLSIPLDYAFIFIVGFILGAILTHRISVETIKSIKLISLPQK